MEMEVDAPISDLVPSKLLNEDSCEKVDSGMDDDSQQSNEKETKEKEMDSDEDDDDVMVTKTVKGKKNFRIFDEDEDESSRSSNDCNKDTDSVPQYKTTAEVLDAVLKDDSDSEAADEENNKEDGDSSDSDEKKEVQSSTLKKKKKRISVFDEDSNDSTSLPDNKSSQNVQDLSPTSEKKAFNTDIFDAEEDGSDKESDHHRSSGDESASDSNKEDDDEGFDESSIDPKLLKKLKKGASKRATAGATRKAKQESMLSIHSETQRIVRESRVNLPYHQPEPKPLSAFLERANKKREGYKAVFHSRDIHKAKAMQDIFQKTKIQTTPPKEEENKDTGDEKKENNNLGKEITDNVKSNVTVTEADVLAEDDLPDLVDRLKDQHGDEIARISSEVDSVVPDSVTADKDEENCSLAEKDSLSENISIEQIVDKDSDVEKSTENSTMVDTDSTLDKGVLNTENSELENCIKPMKKTESGSNASLLCEQKDQEDSQTMTKSLLSKLPELSAPPKLSGGPNSFIDFEENGEECEKNSGVSLLRNRFLKHTQKKKKHIAKDVDISIVQKEKCGDQEELKMKSFTYHPTEEEENSLSQLDTPGAKLLALKGKLEVDMRQKREESRKHRQDLYNLDNEEGGYSDEEILDDHEEMSDKSDTDIEDEEFDEEFGDLEGEVEEETGDKEENPFADDEAEESDNNEDDEENDGSEVELRLQLSDDEASNNEKDDDNNDIAAPKTNKKLLSAKKKPKRLVISDDEDEASRGNGGLVISKSEEIQPLEDEESTASSKKVMPATEDNLDDDFVPFSKHLTSAQYPARKKTSSLSLPIEDSQDLYGFTQNIASLPMDTQSQSLNFSLEESQSQMLDADGFLKVGSTSKKPSKTLNFASCDIPATQDNMDELLGLCSGRFAATENEGDKKSCKNLFGQATQATQGNMKELLGLCSGKFMDSSTSNEDASQKSGVKRKVADIEDDDDDSNSSLRLESDDEARHRKDASSDAKEEEEADDEGDIGGRDENSTDSCDIRKQKFKGFTEGNKHGRIRKDFVEQEAELSGSEYDSDENLDLAEEDDILEMEEGDKDAVGTEEELRNQVGRAHLKQVIDEDKRELMRFQEMYLPDGDLHSEGGGRIRRFKWSGINDDTQQDMFDNDSDIENQEEEDQDSTWRKDRFEREKFLQEQQENDSTETEDSQFLKLGKVFLKRRDSDSGTTKKLNMPAALPVVKTTAKAKEAPGTPTSILKLSKSRRGSFLSRDKDTLAKIAEKTKGSSNPTGVKNSRNFVFQVLSPDKDSNSQAMPAPTETKVRKAHKPKSVQPAAKKIRLEKDSSFSQNSVFQHL